MIKIKMKTIIKEITIKTIAKEKQKKIQKYLHMIENQKKK